MHLRTALVPILLLLLWISAGSHLYAQTEWPQSPGEEVWSVDGEVYDSAVASDGTIYIAGDFSYVGRETGPVAILDPTTGRIVRRTPMVEGGQVRDAVPDGSGGWIIVGDFTTVEGLDIPYAARIDRCGQVDETWVPKPNDEVFAIERIGQKVYLGGRFTYLGNQSGNSAVIDLLTGTEPFQFPELNAGTIRKIIPDGQGGWFVAGGFSQIGGQSVSNLTHIMPNGTVDQAWTPNPNGTVTDVVVHNGKLYLSGAFTNVAGQTRNRLAAIDPVNAALDNWNPNVNATVEEMAISGTTMFIRGSFTAVGVESRSGLAEIFLSTGTATSWELEFIDRAPALIRTDDSQLYFSGNFSFVGEMGNGPLKWDPSSRTRDASFPQTDGEVRRIISDGAGGYFIGGNFDTVGGVTKKNLARILSNGSVDTTFSPEPDNSVLGLALHVDSTGNPALYVAGAFTSIGGANRDYLAAVNPTSGVANSFSKNCDSGTVSLLIVGNELIVGGGFQQIDGQNRNCLAAIHIPTDTVTAWDPSPDKSVNCLATDGTYLYIGGSFRNVGGMPRDYLASIPLGSSTPDAWAPDPLNDVTTIDVVGQFIYVGGGFTRVFGGQSVDHIFRVDAATRQLDAWRPTPNGRVREVATDGTDILICGQFDEVDGYARIGYARLDAGTGQVKAGAPGLYSTSHQPIVWDMLYDGGMIYLAANADRIGVARSGLAAIDLGSREVSKWAPEEGWVSTMEADGTTVYIAGGFRDPSGGVHTLIATDTTDGTWRAWDPNPNLVPTSLSLRSNSILVGGDFSVIAGETRGGFAEIDKTTGQATSLRFDVDGRILQIGNSGNTAVVSGDLDSHGGDTRKYFAELNASNGETTTWTPLLDASATMLHAEGNTLYLYGGMTAIEGQARFGLASFDTTSQSLLPWAPTVNGSVYSMVADGSHVYLGGSFSDINGTARNHLGRVNAVTGTLDGWAPEPDALVTHIRQVLGRVFVGGEFSRVGGELKSYGAEIDINTGAPTAWIYPLNASPDTFDAIGTELFIAHTPLTAFLHTNSTFHTIYDAAQSQFRSFSWDTPHRLYFARSDDETLLLGGGFQQCGGFRRENIAAFDPTTGRATDWNPERPDGVIRAVSVTDNLVYAAGEFSRFGYSRPEFAVLDTDGKSTFAPNPDNNVFDAIPDGNGGWFVAGRFNQIGGGTAPLLARILPNGQLDRNFVYSFTSPASSPSVTAIARYSNLLLIGGYFDSVNGDPHENFVVINTSTGQKLGVTLDFDGPLSDIAVDGNTIYIAGNFQTALGQARNRLAAIDANSASLTSWDPNADSTVSDILIEGSTAYIAGSFFNVGGAARQRLAALNLTTGAATGFSADSDGPVRTLASDGTYLYVGGTFGTIGGSSRSYAAQLSLTTGAPTAWNPDFDDDVFSLSVENSILYAGGTFESIGTDSRQYAAAFTLPALQLTDFDPRPSSGVSLLEANPEGIAAAGGFYSIGGPSRTGLVAFDRTTAEVEDWNPDIPARPTTLDHSGSTLFAGGEFKLPGESTYAEQIVSVDLTSGNLTATAPSVQGSSLKVHDLHVHGSMLLVGGEFDTAAGGGSGAFRFDEATNGQKLFTSFNDSVRAVVDDGNGGWFVGGAFTTVDYQSRYHLARIKSDGSLDTAWDVQTYGGLGSSGAVYDLKRVGGTLYIAGSFRTVGSTSRSNVAAVDIATQQVTSWAPEPNDDVNVMLVNSGTMYIGGDFTSLNGSGQSYLASIDLSAGTVNSWGPNFDGEVHALALRNSTLLVGGAFFWVGGVQRNYLVELDLTTGNPTFFAPAPNNVVRALAMDGTTLILGGDFGQVLGQSRSRICSIDFSSNQLSGWNPSLDGNVYSITVGGGNWYIGGAFDRVNLPTAQDRIAFASFDAASGNLNAWTPDPGGTVYATYADATDIVIGGTLSGVGSVSRSNFAAFDLATGSPNSITASANQPVYSIAAYGNSAYIGGAFTKIGSSNRNRIAQIDLISGALSSWDPASGIFTVNGLAADDTWIYAVGDTWLAAIRRADGSRSTWFPRTISPVRTVQIVNGIVYAGGEFETVENFARTGFCGFTPTRAVDVFASSANGTYGTGDQINLEMLFNREITIVGSPTLELETGTQNGEATFANGATGRCIELTYSVSANHDTLDLDYTSSSAVQVGAGAIDDGSSSPPTPQLPTPGSPGSLGYNSDIHVDGQAPGTPVITSPTQNSLITTASITASGTGEVGTTVYVEDGIGTAFGNTFVDGQGNWTVSIGTFTQGSHTIRARAENGLSQSSPYSPDRNFTVDSIAPASPALLQPSDGETLPSSFVVSGTAEALANIEVRSDGTTTIGSTAASASGLWSVLVGPITNGNYQIDAVATDAAGNASTPSTSISVTVDATNPVAPVVVTPSDGATIPSPNITITGTAERTVTVIVEKPDGTQLASTTSDINGDWSTVIGPFPLGSVAFRTLARDQAANDSPYSAIISVTIDYIAPTAPVITSPPSGAVTSSNTVTVVGTGEAGTVITLREVGGANLGTDTVDGSGAWSITPGTFSQGNYTLAATAEDAAANVSNDSNQVDITFDRTPPGIPVISSPANGSTVYSSIFDVSGTAEANATVEVFVAGGSSLGTTTADSSGNWTVSVGSLPDSTFTIEADATDTAGNTGNRSASISVTIDTSNSFAPVITTPTSGDVFTSTNVVVSGVSDPFYAIEVLEGSTVHGSTTADGAGNWSVSAGPINEGGHSLRAQATDLGGGKSQLSNLVTVFIDTIAPPSPSILTPTDLSSHITRNILVSGTAEIGAEVQLKDGNGTLIATLSTDNSGDWSSSSLPLQDGDHTLRAYAIDIAGNVSTSSNSVRITIDTSVPAAPIISSPTTGDTITAHPVSVSGTAEPLVGIEILNDSDLVLGTGTSDTNGDWSVDLGDLANGNYTFHATAGDDAGNTSIDSNNVTITVNAPTPPVGGGGGGGGGGCALVSGHGTSHQLFGSMTPFFLILFSLLGIRISRKRQKIRMP